MSVDKLTILTPLHYRTRYIKRNLSHTDSFGCPRIIVDSSADSNLDLLKNYDIRYLHYPDTLYYKKLRHALDYVETPYVIHLLDDDFALKGGLVSCVDLLEKNVKFVGATGAQARLIESTKRIDVRYRRLVHLLDRILMGHLYMPNSQLWMKLKAFFAYYEYNHFVYRTNTLKEWLDLSINTLAFQPALFNEKILQLWMNLNGGLGVVPEYLLIRSDDHMTASDPQLLVSPNNEIMFDLDKQQPLSRTPWKGLYKVLENDELLVSIAAKKYAISKDKARKLISAYFNLVQFRSDAKINKILTHLMTAYYLVRPIDTTRLMKQINLSPI